MATGLTEALADFISGLSFTDLPPDVPKIVGMGFADCVGCIIAGRNERAPQVLKEVLQSSGKEAALYCSRERAGAPEAAWINGTAAHALDYDDANFVLRGHISAVLVPAIMAEAERLGASGKKMIVAYAAGYESWGELSRRDLDDYLMKGWHTTSVFGAVSAAAACASLLGLGKAETSSALGIAASQSGGLVSNFGSMTKPFHAGKAAYTGVMSARLAQAGMTASADSLEHPQGFLQAFSPAGRSDRATPVKAGREWQMLAQGLSIKRFPMCYMGHKAIDAALSLRDAYGIRPGDILGIDVETSQKSATIMKNHRPQNGMDAKFSMEFAMAAAFLSGNVGLAELDDAFVRRSDISSLMEAVSISPYADGSRPGDRVTVKTRDGRELVSADFSKARGAWGLQLTEDELFQKFGDCLASGGYDGNARALFDALLNLERLDSAAYFGSLGAAGTEPDFNLTAAHR